MNKFHGNSWVLKIAWQYPVISHTFISEIFSDTVGNDITKNAVYETWKKSGTALLNGTLLSYTCNSFDLSAV